MRVADIGLEDLPQLAGLYETLTGLTTPLPCLEEAFARMAGHPDYHLLGVRCGDRLAGGRSAASSASTAWGSAGPFWWRRISWWPRPTAARA